MKKRRKIVGILGMNVSYEGNFENIGKILFPHFHLNLIGNTNTNQILRNIYSIKNYTRTKGKNYLTWFFRDFINLWHYCWKEKPNLLCSLKNPDFQGPLVVIFGKLFGIKTVVRFSGSRFDYYRFNKGFKKIATFLLMNIFMRLIIYADKVICMGEEQKRELMKRRCKKEKIEILLQPTNELLFKPSQNRDKLRKELNLPPNKKILLYVGAIVDYKGINSLVKLAKYVVSSYHFVLVGEDRQNYYQRFSKVTQNFTFAGKMSPEELVKYYQTADLLIHPSYIEGFPKTVLEAAACGLPIIARDIVSVGRVADKVFKTD
ncbi:MAG: glycosyltransferase family 4 protein, partial [Candidatus Hodarchaeota archaeon]